MGVFSLDPLAKRSWSGYVAADMGKVITRDAEIFGGEPVFKGTRVPIKSLFDHLEAGDTIEVFLDGFPSVTREQVMMLLEESSLEIPPRSPP